jgi:hypothetical protein
VVEDLDVVEEAVAIKLVGVEEGEAEEALRKPHQPQQLQQPMIRVIRVKHQRLRHNLVYQLHPMHLL